MCMLNKYTTVFSMACGENGLFHISDSDIWFILPLQLQNITQCHQIICGCKISVQAGTYQESFNRWHKQQLKIINNRENLFMSWLDEQFNAENIASRYIEVVLTYGEPIHTCSECSEFSSMCDFPERDINFPKLSCVLKCWSKCTYYIKLKLDGGNVGSNTSLHKRFLF